MLCYSYGGLDLRLLGCEFDPWSGRCQVLAT